jgi:uncharacterized protein YndB with AHSA1/START domain
MTVPIQSSNSPGSIRTTIDIAAAPDAVFAALSDQGELAAWLGGGDAPPGAGGAAPVSPSLAIPGQPWRVSATAPDGSPGSVSGELILVDPPRRLDSTWRASWDGFAPDRVSFELTPIRVGGATWTRLIVTHTRAGAHLRVTAMASSSDRGEWPALLARLAAWLSAPVGATRRTSVGDWT